MFIVNDQYLRLSEPECIIIVQVLFYFKKSYVLKVVIFILFIIL